MLKRKLCEAVFTWNLTCKGPLLIKDERWSNFLGSKKDGYPDCIFISHITLEEIKKKAPSCAKKPPILPYYIPGTSIRGPFRARAEMIIRSLLPENADPGVTACDPFEQEDPKTRSCSKRLENTAETTSKYGSACPACKIFGCGGLASRIAFTDADIENGYRSVYRDMVGIDRFTGGAYKGAGDEDGGALMRFHVLENTSFTTTVRLVNFELWQLGLLAYVFRDFEEELVPIGFGKTKGFGLVKGSVEKIELHYPDSTDKVEDLHTLIQEDKERSFYKIFGHKMTIQPGLKKQPEGFSLYHTYSVEDIKNFWQDTAPAFNTYIEHLKRSKAGDKGLVTEG